MNIASLNLHIADTRTQLGQQAASDIAKAIRTKLATKDQLRIVFAAAPSQSEMLAALQSEENIDWKRITAFHMDEYIGLSKDAPQRFGNWLKEAFFDCVPLAGYHLIDPGDDPEATCRRYAALLAEEPIDFVLLGIGVNAHLAFNDPPANLEDPLGVRIVTLDEKCRMQQVDDECFTTLNEVPQKAVTLTIPTLMRGEELFCCVPGATKAEAVRDMALTPISGKVPATILRAHPRCSVYLDHDSSALLLSSYAAAP